LTIAQRAGSLDLQGSALIERGRAAWEIGRLAENRGFQRRANSGHSDLRWGEQ